MIMEQTKSSSQSRLSAHFLPTVGRLALVSQGSAESCLCHYHAPNTSSSPGDMQSLGHSDIHQWAAPRSTSPAAALVRFVPSIAHTHTAVTVPYLFLALLPLLCFPRQCVKHHLISFPPHLLPAP